jgi:hypothetical protein
VTAPPRRTSPFAQWRFALMDRLDRRPAPNVYIRMPVGDTAGPDAYILPGTEDQLCIVDPQEFRLTARLRRRVVQRATQCSTMAEALQMATRDLIGGMPVYRNHADANPEDLQFAHDLISFQIQPEHPGASDYAVALVTAEQEVSWHCGPQPLQQPEFGGPPVQYAPRFTDKNKDEQERYRAWLITEALWNYRLAKAPAMQMLTDAEKTGHLLSSHAAVMHWFDQRLADGHSVKSARTLLALIMPLGVHARIEFSPEGHPLPRTH